MKKVDGISGLTGTLLGIILFPTVAAFWLAWQVMYWTVAWPFKLIGALRRSHAEAARERERIMYNGWW